MMVNISSLFALFIGMFSSQLVRDCGTQRRSEIGILRALGATRQQIRWLFLGESAVTGLIGSIGGLVFGLVIARGIAASIGDLISDVYGVAQHADEVATSPTVLLTALVIGITTSIIAALIPARQAARVDPVQALQKGKYQVLSAGESRVRTLLAAALGLVSIGCLLAGSSRIVFYAGYAMAIGVALLLGPLMSLGLSRALRPILKWIRPVEGALAADSLIQAPRRTSASVAAVMLSLALVVAFAGWRARVTSRSSTGCRRRSTRIFRHAVAGHRGSDPAISCRMNQNSRRCRASRVQGVRSAGRVPADTGDGRGRRRQSLSETAKRDRSPARP
jgi:putative ABC transport system permease protein